MQWSRNARMDGPRAWDSDGAAPKDKPCNNIQRWVLDYGSEIPSENGNILNPPIPVRASERTTPMPGQELKKEEKIDNWNVLIHWRKIRCCSRGGVPILIFPQFAADESLSPIQE